MDDFLLEQADPLFHKKRWMFYLKSMSIHPEFTEAHHPNVNLAKCQRHCVLKAVVVHLL